MWAARGRGLSSPQPRSPSFLLPLGPRSPPTPTLSSASPALATSPPPLSLGAVGAVVLRTQRGEGREARAVYRNWSSSIHQLCLELETKHNKYLGSSPAVLSLNLAIRTPNLSGLLVLRTQFPPHPTPLPPPTELPPGKSSASETRDTGLRLGCAAAWLSEQGHVTLLARASTSLSVKWGCNHCLPRPRPATSHVRSECAGRAPTPVGSLETGWQSFCLLGRGRGPSIAQAGSGQRREGDPASAFWEFVCSSEQPFQLEGGETSRTSGLALQARVGFPHVDMEKPPPGSVAPRLKHRRGSRQMPAWGWGS